VADVTRPVGPYAPVRRAGDWIVTSGQLGVVPGENGEPVLVRGGAAAELRQALANLAAVLAQEGADLSHVVKTTLFLADMADFPEANEVWVEVFGDHRPTRSAVGVAALPMGARAEVEAWAHRVEGAPPQS
jgi:2-iminobutanoate/2-iminopropanoate deaminase